MSVCVSSSTASSIVGGMSMPHNMPTLTPNMMHPLPHQMQSSLIANGGIGGSITTNGIMDHAATPSENQDHPNPDMLLALISRNKALEGEWVKFLKFDWFIEQTNYNIDISKVR